MHIPPWLWFRRLVSLDNSGSTSTTATWTQCSVIFRRPLTYTFTHGKSCARFGAPSIAATLTYWSGCNRTGVNTAPCASPCSRPTVPPFERGRLPRRLKAPSPKDATNSNPVIADYAKASTMRLTKGPSAGSSLACHSSRYSLNIDEDSGRYRTEFHIVGSFSKSGSREYATTAFLSL